MLKWILSGALLLPMLAQGASPDAQPKTSPPIPKLLLPATGYWLDATRPGTGFALERRGNMLGVVFYHFSDVDGQSVRAADWHLANGPLVGDTFEATLLHFEGGSCLGCDPFVAADAEQTGAVVRLVFASAREATLQVDDGELRRVVAMPYGVPYETALATPDDLPLPDLRGRWVLRGDGGELGVITLDQRVLGEDGAVEFHGTAYSLDEPNAALRCTATDCELWTYTPALPTPPRYIADFDLGDITEERMSGRDGLTFPVQAFRVFGMEGQP